MTGRASFNVRHMPGRGMCSHVTVENVSWEFGKKGNGVWITVPIGTEFDVSVPWWARWFINPCDERWFLGALVHDYLLASGRVGRAQAAAEFYDGALAGGAPPWKARLAFVAVAAWAVYKPVLSGEP